MDLKNLLMHQPKTALNEISKKVKIICLAYIGLLDDLDAFSNRLEACANNLRAVHEAMENGVNEPAGYLDGLFAGVLYLDSLQHELDEIVERAVKENG